MKSVLTLECGKEALVATVFIMARKKNTGKNGEVQLLFCLQGGPAPLITHLDHRSPFQHAFLAAALTPQHLSSLQGPPEATCGHLSQAPPSSAPSIPGLRLPQGKSSNSSLTPKALHDLWGRGPPYPSLLPLTCCSFCSRYTGLLTLLQHARPGPAPGPLHVLCPLLDCSSPWCSHTCFPSFSGSLLTCFSVWPWLPYFKP